MFGFGGAASGGGACGGPGGAPGGGPGGAPGAFGTPPAPTPVIIIVPLNFDAAAFGFSGEAHATHCVAVSVLGFPQFGQKTVTGASGPSLLSSALSNRSADRRVGVSCHKAGGPAKPADPSMSPIRARSSARETKAQGPAKGRGFHARGLA
jgi:hypothetical protein